MSRNDPHDAVAQLLRGSEAGLRAYLLCRVGSLETASGLYDRVRERLASGVSPHLRTAPSLKAVAYAEARELAAGTVPSPGIAMDGIAWHSPSHPHEPRYVEALDRCRRDLPIATAEALELKYARRLEHEEIAYVVGVTAQEVENLLCSGSETVQQIASSELLEPVPTPEMVADAFHALASGNRGTPAAEIPPPLREGAWVVDRFQVVSTLCSSTEMSAYLVEDRLVPGESIVLHVLTERAATTAARRGLLSKLHRIALVADPTIEKILTYGWTEDRLWYATPRYRGETLEDLLAAGPLTLEETGTILLPIWRGLAALHERGIVHRQISPERIWLVQAEGGSVSEALPILASADGWLTGSPMLAWAAPEVSDRVSRHENPGEPDASEDVYSLGMTTLHAVAPKLAKTIERGSDTTSIEESADLGSLGPILQASLSSDPSARPSAVDVCKKLARLGRDIERQRRKRAWTLGLGLGALVLALFAVTYFVRESRRQLIEDSLRAVDVQEAEQELEAERERVRELEALLETPDSASSPP